MWSGEFSIGNCFAVYSGNADSNDMHRHASYQLILCHSDHVEVTDKSGEILSASAALIKPLEYHSIRSDSQLTMIYLEPQSDLAFKLIKDTIDVGIIKFDSDKLPFKQHKNLKIVIDSLSSYAQKPATHIDHRVLVAMEFLHENVGNASIAEAAKACGLSESRLRELVRKQLGVPLATWHRWCKLQTTTDRLRKGDSLVEAAIAGGFSDQAHFTRTMHEMFGITPSAAIATLR